LAARLGGLDLRAAAVDPFADLSRDDAVALAAEAAKSDGAPADRCRLFDTAARALLFRHAEHRAAERIFAEAEAEAEQGGLAYARVAALLGQATCRLARGDLDDAVAMREVADGLLPRLAPSDRSASVARVTFPGSVALYRGGDWRVLHNAATAALAAPHIAGSPAPGVVAAYDALFAVRSGDPSAARGRIAATLRIAAALGPRGYVADGIAGLAATASAELGDPAPAIDELLAAFQAAGCGGYVVVTLPLARARLATVIDPAAGAALLAAAGAEAERRELAGIAALARVEAALALHRAGDRDGARRTAADVAPALDRIGAPALVAAIAGLLDGVPRPTALPNGLSAREAEVLALLADGATSAEIAGRLVLSPHTVNRHVANAYAKAGLRNRAEAASYALRSGLVGSGRD
jgi:DNA-binding CsgD family transcriptional regulator